MSRPRANVQVEVGGVDFAVFVFLFPQIAHHGDHNRRYQHDPGNEQEEPHALIVFAKEIEVVLVALFETHDGDLEKLLKARDVLSFGMISRKK